MYHELRKSGHSGSSAARFTAVIAMVLLGALMMLRLSAPAAAQAQKDSNACLRTSNALYKRGEELHKKRRWQIPREFGRIAANLDDYCRDKVFHG